MKDKNGILSATILCGISRLLCNQAAQPQQKGFCYHASYKR